MPLIHALRKMPKGEASDLLKTIKKGKLSGSQVKVIVKKTIELGGINYAQNAAKDYSDRAKANISILPDSDAKKALMNFADFVILRDL